jgi:ribosomal protein L16 Arg81 hydroxylase
VFVLQLAGKKRWSIYPPVVTLPHRTQLFTPQAYSGQAPTVVVELSAGDLLYLPRGFLHSTCTADSFSAHATIGITVYTWVDLIREALASAIEDEGLRHALPPGFASRSGMQSLLREKMLSALDTLPARANADRLIDSFTTRVRGAHVGRPPPFRADVTVIDLTSALQMPTHDRYTLIHDRERRLLDFEGTRYQLTEPVAVTLDAMSRLGTFKAAELPEHLDADSRLELLRHLLDIQFLTRAH